MSKKKDSFKPWLSRPAINRSVTIPFTTSLTHRLSSLGEFHPNELDPFLLFDARDSMIGTLENPTLDLDPSKPDTLNVITATRAGVATFTDANGLIATAPANTVRVDQTQGAELTPTKFQNIGYTDFANSYWVARGFTKVGTVEGPLGYTGYEFLENNTNSNPGVFINSNLSDGSPMTFGVWLKASSPISVALATTGAVKTSTINITTDWQFFSCTDSTNTNTGPHIGGFATITQGSGVTLFAAMPQLEEGTTASDFVANTTGSPKFITGATFGPRVPMILVEPSATNLFPYSEDFSQGSWNKNRVTIVDNSITSPDGSLNAAKLVETATTATHLTWTQATTTAAAHSFSVFAKAGERKRIGLRDNQIGNSAVFDLESGSVISGSGGSIAQAANGFFRITLTGTYAAAGTRHEIYVLPENATTANTSYTGDGTSGVYIWGAQLETGSVATSLIPTAGSTVTRAKDDLVISGSAFSGFFNASEGTTYIETVPKTITNIPHLFEYHNSSDSNANRMGAYLPNISLNAFVRSSGVTTASLTVGNINLNQLNRVAISYKVDDILGSLNGASEVADTSAALPSGLDKLHIGNVYNFNFPLNGHIKRLIYWPYHSDSL